MVEIQSNQEGSVVEEDACGAVFSEDLSHGRSMSQG